MKFTPVLFTYASWILLALYWLFSAFGVKRAAKREASGERFVHILFMAAGYILLFNSDSRFGVLNERFIPENVSIEWLGAAITLGGVLFAVWARRSIGKFWSAAVTIKEDHKLIRSGPYAHIRHPIYTGLLTAVAGTAVEIGRYRALLALVIFLIGFARKAKKEEVFLAQQFGESFEEHKRHTGFFLPRFS
jgi:protein-S-isoprenylcysteine O-methyltransferase Ste14